MTAKQRGGSCLAAWTSRLANVVCWCSRRAEITLRIAACKIVIARGDSITNSVLETLDRKKETQIIKIDKVVIKDAGKPIEKDKQNNYSCFNDLKGKNGVYVFQHKTEGVLYVGRAGKAGKDQDLYERVQQHYRPGDVGATFRKNWAESNCNVCKGKKSCSRDEPDCSFNNYEALICGSRIIFFCCDDYAALQCLECRLGCSLRSKYSQRDAYVVGDAAGN